MNTNHSVRRNKKGIYTLAIAFALGAIVALAGFSLTTTTAGPDSDVVVSVNGVAVTRDAFFERLEEEAGESILDMLITELLIEQAQHSRGVQVTDDEIAAEIDLIKANYPSDEAFEESLVQFGLTPKRLHHNILLRLIVNKLSQDGVEVTDEEIQTFFEENKASFDRPESVLVAHILVDTKEEADEILKELNDGADFAELAKEKSGDPGSASRGGSIGYIEPDSPITEPFKQAAFALKEGETSAPINTEFGWHVIRVHERTEAVEATLESTQDQVREILLQQKARSDSEVLHDLWLDANIEVQWSRYTMFQTAARDD